MNRVIIALGSNLGARLTNLQDALRSLEAAGIHVVAKSSVWETEPVPADQPRFLNAVVAAETELAPHDLLAALKAIERGLGRRPGRRWGPRPIDLDILFYGDLSLDDPDLTIPHPRIAERAFVLVPLAEVESGPLPVLNRTASALLESLDASGVERTDLAL